MHYAIEVQSRLKSPTSGSPSSLWKENDWIMHRRERSRVLAYRHSPSISDSVPEDEPILGRVERFAQLVVNPLM
jgi:hypothetical protein